MTFQPENYYSFNRMPQRRSLLRAASRDYEVYFTNIESVLDKLRDIFNHMINKLISEIQEDLPGHDHRIRLVLNAPTLNYPIHIPFSSADDFNADLVLNEIDRVVNSNESFDISNNIKVNVLSVSLPTMGGQRIGGIQNRIVPDIKLFKKQKKSVIAIKSDNNDCLMKAIAVGMFIAEKPIQGKIQTKKLNLDRASTQSREMHQLMIRLRASNEIADSFFTSLPQTVEKRTSTNSSHCEDDVTEQQPLALQHLDYLSTTSVLKHYCISLYDSNFMGTFLKCYNSHATKHIDLLYDSNGCHIDVITSMKGLFDARHYCYSCHKAFSTIKHLCSASGCMLCRQSGCSNRTGFVNLSQPGRSTQMFQCDRCQLKLRSLNCLQCHISSGVCHLYTQCPSCNNAVPKRAFSNHLCSKKRCSICSVFFSVSDRKNNNSNSSAPLHQCFVQKPNKQRIEGSNDDTQSEQNSSTWKPKPKTSQKPHGSDIWVFDIETDQSCRNEGVHKPILLVTESLTGDSKVYIGYDCINEFCNAVFNSSERIRKTEWFIAHFGSGFDFLPILEWLYKQHKYIPKILLRGNKVVSMRVGNKRFIDSYLFIPIPLSKFPATFNLTELKKGYFPHFLTSAEALNPSAENPLHSFYSCEKGPNCSHRQIVSTSCKHCLAFTRSRAPESVASKDKSGSSTIEEEFAMKKGQFPPACLFALNSMKGAKSIDSFLKWHEEQTLLYQQQSKQYDFGSELVAYCQSDVKLLKEGFLEYRRLIQSICSGIDPFEIACTAASACNYIYRQLFMPNDSIAILPNNGYTGSELTSFPAATWLSWVEQIAFEELQKQEQQHEMRLYKSGGGSRKGKGREQTLGSFKVDGLLLYKSKATVAAGIHSAIVLEFFGCYFHGCPDCYPDGAEVNKKRNGVPMRDLYTQTVVDRLDWLHVQRQQRAIFSTTDHLNFVLENIFYIWECEFNKLFSLSVETEIDGSGIGISKKPNLPATLGERINTEIDDAGNVSSGFGLDQETLYTKKNIAKLQILSSNLKRYSPLQPREAFVGGRTENFVTQWSRTLETESFCYVDVCSLYPYVNSRSLYPRGHPDEIYLATEQHCQNLHRDNKDVISNLSNPEAGSRGTSTTSSSNRKSTISDSCNSDGPVKFLFLEHSDRILKLNKRSTSYEDQPHGSKSVQQPPHSTPCFSQVYLSQFPNTPIENKILNSELFGLIKCQVLPPSDLHLPILPFKHQSKLFFPLCRSCVEGKSVNLDRRSMDFTSNLCSHFEPEDRGFWGTFATPEIRLALENKYRILDVAEVWNWRLQKRSTSLFKDYINTFLKIKLEASGWPKERCCETETADLRPNTTKGLCEHKKAFLLELERKEGLIIDGKNVSKNEGLRFIAKILLNSFWGYLGMRDNMPKTRYINSYREVVDYFTSRTKRVTDATLVGDDLMLLQYQLIDDAADAPRKTNVILAAFTTAHARIILYKNMQLVKNPRNVLYCDTDSIMYIHDRSQSEIMDIPIGSGLGEMTNELPEDVLIDKFWSAGPKFYCMSGHRIPSGLEYNIFKVKGVTLNRATEKTFNPTTFKKLVLGETHELRSPFSSLSRCVRTGQIKTRTCEKRARVTSNKRVFDTKTGVSIPYGFLLSS